MTKDERALLVAIGRCVAFASLADYRRKAVRKALAAVEREAAESDDLPARSPRMSDPYPHHFVGGYEIDPSQPNICQVCGGWPHEH